eukprot:CAMPEP_0119085378 /NCGR_PEP_ID=MMETSP1178-20130426/133555_1 /TAXON_ID=33656 /ORGANISM="unid sp, Strain CCMP2000" /LENGTH=82 /DNA_ID=CAMNT_0007068429 /DNA_START=541 /DNA_END=786 /DNA_ORIENTATION=+
MRAASWASSRADEVGSGVLLRPLSRAGDIRRSSLLDLFLAALPHTPGRVAHGEEKGSSLTNSACIGHWGAIARLASREHAAR